MKHFLVSDFTLRKNSFGINLKDYRDDIDSEDVFHLSAVHLQAVERYEDQEKKEKVVKHLKGFKEMLDKQQDEEMISDEAFDLLQEQTDLLIAKWK